MDFLFRKESAIPQFDYYIPQLPGYSSKIFQLPIRFLLAYSLFQYMTGGI